MSKKKTTKKGKVKPKKNGRPTKYKPEFCKEIIDFYDREPYEDIELEHYGKDGELKWVDKKRMPNKMPTVNEFAKHIGVSYATVYDWLDPKMSSFQKKFLQSYTHAKKAQKNFIIQNGLQGLYNPIFAKFVAINVTDMRDQIDYNPIPVDNVENRQKLADMSREEVDKAIVDQIFKTKNKNKKKI
jgi:hypothetical protein